jgi:hypothetical protein
MQTTLRVDPALYRDAKAAAAREGVTLTRFIHSALEMRLNAVTRRSTALPVFDSGAGRDFDVLALIQSADDEFAQVQVADSVALANEESDGSFAQANQESDGSFAQANKSLAK